MARISKPPRERRREIIDTATALFLKQGYDQTTVHDIVQQVGVAQGLFYYYFKSKEDVLYAAVEVTAQHLLDDIARLISTGSADPVERIRAALSGIADFLRHGFYKLRPTGSVSLRMLVEQQTICQLLPYLCTLLRDGHADHVFDAPYPEHTARFFLTGFIGLFSDEASFPTPEALLQFIHLMIERILRLPAGTFSADKE